MKSEERRTKSEEFNSFANHKVQSSKFKVQSSKFKVQNSKLKIMLQLKIVSPEKVVFQGEVESVLVPGTIGSFEILKDHAPIISSLEEGKVEYTTKEGKQAKNEVSLCVEV